MINSVSYVPGILTGILSLFCTTKIISVKNPWPHSSLQTTILGFGRTVQLDIISKSWPSDLSSLYICSNFILRSLMKMPNTLPLSWSLGTWNMRITTYYVNCKCVTFILKATRSFDGWWIHGSCIRNSNVFLNNSCQTLFLIFVIWVSSFSMGIMEKVWVGLLLRYARRVYIAFSKFWIYQKGLTIFITFKIMIIF